MPDGCVLEEESAVSTTPGARTLGGGLPAIKVLTRICSDADKTLLFGSVRCHTDRICLQVPRSPRKWQAAALCPSVPEL